VEQDYVKPKRKPKAPKYPVIEVPATTDDDDNDAPPSAVPVEAPQSSEPLPPTTDEDMAAAEEAADYVEEEEKKPKKPRAPAAPKTAKAPAAKTAPAEVFTMSDSAGNVATTDDKKDDWKNREKVEYTKPGKATVDVPGLGPVEAVWADARHADALNLMFEDFFQAIVAAISTVSGGYPNIAKYPNLKGKFRALVANVGVSIQYAGKDAFDETLWETFVNAKINADPRYAQLMGKVDAKGYDSIKIPSKHAAATTADAKRRVPQYQACLAAKKLPSAPSKRAREDDA
jgi:hypothetical protein